MKKTFLLLVAALLLSFTACADRKQAITLEQLPEAAQTVIKTYFNVNDIAYIIKETELRTEYDVRLNGGEELEFDSKGTLTKVDCKTYAVPDGLLPEAVKNYVQANYPKAFVKEWARDDNRWKAELNNGLELLFDKKYKFVGIDD